MWRPLFDIILLPPPTRGRWGQGGSQSRSPSSGINLCSSLLFLLADSVLGKKGQSRDRALGTGSHRAAHARPHWRWGWHSERNLLRTWWLWPCPQKGLAWEDGPSLTFPSHLVAGQQSRGLMPCTAALSIPWVQRGYIEVAGVEQPKIKVTSSRVSRKPRT